jgi:hypothetical protein
MQAMSLLEAFNKDRALMPQPLANPPPLAPLPTLVLLPPDARTQEMIKEKLKRAEELGKFFQWWIDALDKQLKVWVCLLLEGRSILAYKVPLVESFALGLGGKRESPYITLWCGQGSLGWWMKHRRLWRRQRL